jgi:chromosome segregation ATPase
VPGDDLNREELKEEVEKLKDELKSARASLKRKKKIRQLEIDNAGNDNQKVANAVASIAKHEAAVEEIETKLGETTERLLALPPEVILDDRQSWFEKIYANGTGYYIEDGLGGWTPVTEENAKRELRSMGIRHRPDTETTSPLDRALLSCFRRNWKIVS